MIPSSEDAIRFAHEDRRSESSINWYVLLFAVIVTLFSVYWGFIRPTSRQLTKLRRYVTSLESSVAALNVQRLSNGQTIDMLEQMAQQEQATKQATDALRDMRDVHRQIVKEAEQLSAAREALDSLVALRSQVARQSTLINSTRDALASLYELRTEITESAEETEEARIAVETVNLLRDGLIDSIHSLDEAEPLISKVGEVHSQIVRAAESSNTATDAVKELDSLRDGLVSSVSKLKDVEPLLNNVENIQYRVSELADSTQATDSAVTKVEDLHQRIQSTVVGRTDEVATAIETLELSTDVKLEMKRASATFDTVKRMLAEFSLMQPAIQQALDSLQPLSELTHLRRLGVNELRQVASNLEYRDASLAHSVVEAPIKIARAPDPIENIETKAVQVAASDWASSTELQSEADELTAEPTPQIQPTAEPEEVGLEKTFPGLPNWTDNEVVSAVVKVVSEAAQEVSAAVEGITNDEDIAAE